MSVKHVIVKRKLGVVLYLGQTGWGQLNLARTYSGTDFAQRDVLDFISATVRPDVTVEQDPRTVENATFYAFKPSGKWKYSGRGHLSKHVFAIFGPNARIDQILADNDGLWPGMSSRADDLTLVVIPDESCEWGYPQMYVREKWT